MIHPEIPSVNGKLHTVVFQAASAYNMMRHLLRYHPHQHAKITAAANMGNISQVIEKAQKEKKTTIVDYMRSTVHESVRTSKIAQAFHIIYQNLSFHSLESPSYALIFTLLGKDPATALSRYELKNIYFPSMLDVTKHQLISTLREVDAINITCDGWSDISGEKYLVVTCHWISNNWKKYDVLLGINHFQTGMTSRAMTQNINDLTAELAGNCMIFNVATDGAANVRKTARTLVGHDAIHCFDHQLHLIVTSVIDKYSGLFIEVREYIKSVRNCSKLRNLLRASQTRSILARHDDDDLEDDLDDLPTTPQVVSSSTSSSEHPPRALMLLLDVPTRWNSTYTMINRFCKLLPVLKALEMSRQADWNILLPLEGKLQTIEVLRVALQPFNDVTKISQSLKFGTLGFVPSWVDYLFGRMSKLISEEQGNTAHFVQDLQRETERRFSYIWNDLVQSESEELSDDETESSPFKGLSTLMAAAFCPQFGQLPFSRITAAIRNNVWRQALQDAGLLIQSSPPSSPSETDTRPIAPLHDNEDEVSISQPASSQRLQTALSAVRSYWRSDEHRYYLASISEVYNLNPLSWWRKNHTKFDSIIYPFVQGVLSAQGTSSAAESQVSGGGNLKTKLRNQLLPKNFSNLLFVKSNIKHLFPSTEDFILAVDRKLEENQQSKRQRIN